MGPLKCRYPLDMYEDFLHPNQLVICKLVFHTTHTQDLFFPTDSFSGPLKCQINYISESLWGLCWLNPYRGFWLFRWAIYLEPCCSNLYSLHKNDCISLLLIALWIYLSSLGGFSYLAIPKRMPTYLYIALHPVSTEFVKNDRLCAFIRLPLPGYATLLTATVHFLTPRLIQAILLKATCNLQKKVPLGDKKPLHCHIKKLISLLLGLIIFLIVFFAPSVARTVCGFVENLFGLLYSKRIVGFMLTLNHLAIKGCTSGSPSIPLSQPALNHNRGCRYDFLQISHRREDI